MIILFLICSLSGKSSDTDSLSGNLQASKAEVLPGRISNPAVWINDCYSRLNNIYLSESELRLDTNRLMNVITEKSLVLNILRQDFGENRARLNIRTVYNLKMRVADIKSDIARWQRQVHKVNESLAGKAREVLVLKYEIREFRSSADSLFQVTFHDAVQQLSNRQRSSEIVILEALRRSTAIENKMIDIQIQVFSFLAEINALLKTKEENLVKRELPAVWLSPPSVYPRKFSDVIAASFHQTLDSIQYYGEMSLWRIVIFRLLIFILCLIPIKLFNDERRKNHILDATGLTFLEKYPKTASLVMGLAFFPLIFVHPPHAFMEIILISLCFTVTLLTLKIYPKINALVLVILVISFLVLSLINFFVTPTFIGRIIYTLSILLLWPLFITFRQLSGYELRHEKYVRLLIIFLALHLVAGWMLVIWGNYTLGRSVILAGYSVLIISMILRIAVFTFLDYTGIITFFLNRRMGSVKINSSYLIQRIRPLLILVSVIFILISYLFTLSIYDILKATVMDFLYNPRKISQAEFTFMNIFLFFLFTYLAFLIAGLLRHLFEPQLEKTVEKRSRFGSYLLWIRLIVICTCIVLGVLFSGLPLNNFTIFLGAIGVGIGFGLQNIVANLVSGLVIAAEKPFVVGDILDFGTDTGRVKEISLRATMVSTSDGADILIPNSTLLSQNIKNWTISSQERYIEIRIETAPDANPVKVTELLNKCLDSQKDILRDKSHVFFSDISDSCYTFTIKARINDISLALPVRSRILTTIQQTLEGEGISMHRYIFPRPE